MAVFLSTCLLEGSGSGIFKVRATCKVICREEQTPISETQPCLGAWLWGARTPEAWVPCASFHGAVPLGGGASSKPSQVKLLGMVCIPCGLNTEHLAAPCCRGGSKSAGDHREIDTCVGL